MKKILLLPAVVGLLFVSANAVFAYQSPGKPTGMVNDFAHVFTAEQKASLENKIGNFKRPAGVELAVVTIPSLGDETIETYAVKLFQEWGIGSKLSDNGILLLVALNERKVRIEVGYGLEGTVTDAQASVIIRSTLTPAFKEGKYYDGVNSAVDQIIGLVEGDPTIRADIDNGMDNNATPSKDYSYFVVLAFILGGNLIALMARSKSWWLGGVLGFLAGLIFVSLIGALVGAVVGLVIDFFLSRFAGDWFKGPRGPRGPGFWFLGGGPGSSSGGGFGGFGGGRSGGGGASGSW